MVFQQVGSTGTIVQTGTGTTATFTVPTGVVNGDLMFVQLDNAVAAASVTPPAGWTQIESTTAGSGALAAGVWFRIANGETAGTTSYTWTVTAGKATGSIHAWRDDAGGSLAVDNGGTAHNPASNTSVTSLDAASVTTSTATARLFLFEFFRNVNNNIVDTAITQPAGFTELVDATTTSTNSTRNAGHGLAYKDLSSAGATGTQTFTLTGTSPSSTIIGVTVAVAALRVSPAGIASGEAFGTATVSRGPVTVSPSGIVTAEAFGSATVTPGVATVSPSGVASAEAWGTAAVSPGSVTVSPTDIDSAEAWGAPTVTLGGVAQTVSPSGIASAEAFGAAVVAPGAVTVSPAGIGSGEAFGTATLTTGPVTLLLSGIGSSEAWGSPTVTVGVPPGVLLLAGIPSGEVWGRPVVRLVSTARPASGRWTWAAAPWNELPNEELAGLRSAAFTARLRGAHELKVTLDGRSRAALLIEEKVTDLWLELDGVPILRGRVGPSSDTLDETSHGTDFAAGDYRALLARRQLYDFDTLSYASQPADNILWALIQTTQGHPAGALGIVRGRGAGTTGAHAADYKPGQTIGAAADDLATSGAFDWDITPVAGSTALHLDVWAAERGIDRGVILEYGSQVTKVTRSVDPSGYANAGRWVGGTPLTPTPAAWGAIVYAAGSVVTHDGNTYRAKTTTSTTWTDTQWETYAPPTPPAPALILAVSDLASRPEGLWDVSEDVSDIVDQGQLNAYGAQRLAVLQDVAPSYTLTLRRGWWGGPSDLWVGDPVALVVKSGRLNVDTAYRVMELSGAWDGDSSQPTVVATVAAAPAGDRFSDIALDRRLAALERR